MYLLAMTEARMPGDPASSRDRQAQETSAASMIAASGPASAARVRAPAQRDLGAKRYKETFRQLIPAWRYPKAVGEKDASYFKEYNDAIAELVSSAKAPDNYGPAVLAASQRLYDDELSRRESINTRCGAVLSTGGILGALFVAAGQLGLMQQKGSYGVAAWFVLTAFLIALAYVGFSITMALAVQASLRGNVVDPGDLAVSASELNPNNYNIHLAKRNLIYTVKNYEVNNLLTFRLHSAQRCLRNGIVAIILAGMLSPLALHTSAARAGALPPGSPAGGQTISTSIQEILS
jgi:hypothetical protein